jgi:hypothetical protein
MAAPEYRDGAWWYRQLDGTMLRWSDAAQVWEPAGTAVGPELPGAWAERPVFKPLAGRANVVRWLLFALIVVSAIAAISDALEYELLGRIERGADATSGEADFNDIRQAVIGVTAFLLNTAVVVTFLMWFSRAYANLPALGIAERRYGQGWSIGAWFVPILNLFRPKQIANDAWKAGDRAAPLPAFLNWWWALWLLSSIADNISFRSALHGDTVMELQATATASLVSDILTIPAALLAIKVVLSTTERQEARAASA